MLNPAERTMLRNMNTDAIVLTAHLQEKRDKATGRDKTNLRYCSNQLETARNALAKVSARLAYADATQSFSEDHIDESLRAL